MSYGIKLRVWGEHACFTRPEMKVERVSYEVMTPSAARGILDAIHWKPAIRWIIDKIHVLKPIRYQSLRRNEVDSKISTTLSTRAIDAGVGLGLSLSVEDHRQRRAATLLVDVDYIIEAHFDLTEKAGKDDSEAKHFSMFNRRAAAGQCFHRPCLGTREFAADFELITEGDPLPPSTLPQSQQNIDLGLMLYDIDFSSRTPRFFRARLQNGVLDVQRCAAETLHLDNS